MDRTGQILPGPVHAVGEMRLYSVIILAWLINIVWFFQNSCIFDINMRNRIGFEKSKTNTVNHYFSQKLSKNTF